MLGSLSNLIWDNAQASKDSTRYPRPDYEDPIKGGLILGTTQVKDLLVIYALIILNYI